MNKLNGLNTKKVVGLDLNYIINLGKALFDNKIDSSNLWKELLELLIIAIFKRKSAVCPYIEETEQESLVGVNRAPQNIGLAKYISNGWDFQDSLFIQLEQISCTLIKLFGKAAQYNVHIDDTKQEHRKYSLRYYNGYEKFKIEDTDFLKYLVEAYIKDRVQLPEIARIELKKELWENFRTVLDAPPGSYEDHADSLIQWSLYGSQFFYNTMRKWLKAVKPSVVKKTPIAFILCSTYDKFYPPKEDKTGFYKQQAQLYGDDDFITAIRRKELYEVPFVKIWATLFVDAQKNLDKDFKALDTLTHDFLRAAAYFPVCDIYCTDTYMKGALYRTGLCDLFNVEVFNAQIKSVEQLIKRCNRL